MQDTSTVLTTTSLVIAIAASIGTILAYMRITKGQIQERAIGVLNVELNALRGRLDDMEQENRRLDQIIVTICEALKKRGLEVSIDGHIVTVSDGNMTQTVRVH